MERIKCQALSGYSSLYLPLVQVDVLGTRAQPSARLAGAGRRGLGHRLLGGGWLRGGATLGEQGLDLHSCYFVIGRRRITKKFK